MSTDRILLSTPHMGGLEQQYVAEVFESNWITPAGPQLDAFELEFAKRVGSKHALALSSGSAALHLALQLSGVSNGDEVLVSTLTFAASVNPIMYLSARPVFIDCDRQSWNMDAAIVAEEVESRVRRGRRPKAIVVVHLYGQSADLDPILTAASRHGIAVVEDAAEALGASYRGRSPGTLGKVGIYSFNGNKIITAAGGGMLVSNDGDLVAHARKLSTQARDTAPHYQHSEIGYNYRMSNVLAAIGRGQLAVLEERVAARRANFEFYQRSLGDLPGIGFMPEASWGRSTRWLSCITIAPDEFGADREVVRLRLERAGIEARPVWKPMHLQPVFAGFEIVDSGVAVDLFNRGLCLPSGSNLSKAQLERVAAEIRAACPRAR